jgi:hypothetical protein
MSMSATLQEILGNQPEQIRAIKNLILDEECAAQHRAAGTTLKPGKVISSEPLEQRIQNIVGDRPELIAQLKQIIDAQAEQAVAKLAKK